MAAEEEVLPLTILVAPAVEATEVEKAADERIAADSERIRSETKAELDALRSRAETRLGDAAEKIVERIVNG